LLSSTLVCSTTKDLAEKAIRLAFQHNRRLSLPCLLGMGY
jgi:hypothetical protein